MSPPPGTAPASLGEDRALGVILVCWHCYNKLSGLTTETCSLTVLGPGSKVKVWTGLVPPGGSDFICSTRLCQLPGASGNHWRSLGFETSLVAQMVKCLPTMQESRVQSLGQEDPLEKEVATHSSTLAWKILWKEEPGKL